MTRRTWFICGGLALLAVGLFLRAARFDFIIYDDRLYVAENRHVFTGLRWNNLAWAFTTWHGGNWHPLTWLSLMIDGQIFGKDPGGYHLTNVLFHAANTVLLFLVLRSLTAEENLRPGGRPSPPVWPCGFVAALFAIHPLHVESVAWITERKDVLSTFFFLLAIGAYVRYAAQPGAGRYLVVALFLIAGLLAKPMIVTLPFVLLLLDYWPLGRISDCGFRIADFWKVVVEKIPLLAISAGFCVVTVLAQKSAKAVIPIDSLSPVARVMQALISYERYLGKIFWPRDLVLPYPFLESVGPLEFCWAVVLLGGISFVALRKARQWPWLVVGWLWFIGTLVPVIGLVRVGSQAMADRYMYIPAIGIFIALTWGLVELFSHFQLPRIVFGCWAAALLAVLGWLTAVQLSYWKDSETLFGHSLAVHPGEVVALDNLATEYSRQRRMPEAFEFVNQILRQRPNDGAIHFHLAELLDASGDKRRAIEEYRLSLVLPGSKANVHMVTALNDLAWLYATAPDDTLRNGDEAVRLALHAGALAGEREANQLDTLAAAYAEQGNFESAIAAANQALQLAKKNDDEDFCREIQERLNLYHHREPFRQSADGKIKGRDG